MATARWFFTEEPNSRFVIQEHLRQGYWASGLATMWVDAQDTTSPYKATGYHGDTSFELEWVPREYLILRSTQPAPDIIRATTLQIGMQPTKTYEDGGTFLAEWRVRRDLPDMDLEPEPHSEGS